MTFIKKPVTGMRDILPDEMELRTNLMNAIRDTYRLYGFTEIETPVVEHIENLTSKQGGDNEKLIFKVLKRGEKLSKALEDLSKDAETEEADTSALCEEGLRYDLTLPLSRYYSANQAGLPMPFKALQMGNVFRADRPQRGRFRQFMQCDIDILGDPTNLAEKELILATTQALEKIGFTSDEYQIVINDRRLLTELVNYCGFPVAEADKILVVLDKMDKIGPDGVDQELKELGYPAESIARLRGLMQGYQPGSDGAREFSAAIGSAAALSAGRNVADIIDAVKAMPGRNIRIQFDPTLVRGMGYYTGTIFEIRLNSFGSSVGGGGRYDRMIGKFTGSDVPAVGFSIGFERIMSLLMENKDRIRTLCREKEAWLMEKGMDAEKTAEIMSEAAQQRAKGKQVLLIWMAKNKKFQKDGLMADGYQNIREFYKNA